MRALSREFDMKQKLLEAELNYRAAIGQERVSVAEFSRRYAQIGYRVNRQMDCKSLARYMTGESAGRSYPSCDTGISEADTGLSAWNVNARRDSNFQRLQQMRGEFFAVTRCGYILEL